MLEHLGCVSGSLSGDLYSRATLIEDRHDMETSDQLRPRTLGSLWTAHPNTKHEYVARLMSMSVCYFVFGLCAIISLAFVPPKAQCSLPQGAINQNANVQADEAMKSRDYPRATALYEQILRDHLDNASAQLHLARAYLLSRQFKAAIDTYQLLLRRDPYNREALIGTGEADNLLGEYKKAEGPLQQALRVAPGDADALWTLSRTYLYESRLGDAERLLKPAIAAHPRDFRLWESLGEVQSHQGRTEDARRSLQQALELNPKAERARILLQARELPKPAMRAPGLEVEFHDYAYLLSDGVGNQILSFPQTLRLSYGTRWRNYLTGEYRRLAFRPGEGSLAVGIASVTDSIEFRVNKALTLTGGGGAAHYTARGITQPVYHAGFEISPVTRLRLSFTYRKRILAPTELAARLALTQVGWSSQLRYSLPKSTNLDFTYYQDHVSDSNYVRGGQAEIRHTLWEKPLRVSVGYQFESLSFARLDLFHGYFSPKRFIANTALVNFKGRKGRFHYDYDLNVGEETYTRPVLISTLPFSFVTQRRSGPRFVAFLRNSYEFNPYWSLQFSFLLYRSALSSGTGAYQAHALLFGLTRHF
jgi:tetratricopeptide (TPR) repeat protein